MLNYAGDYGEYCNACQAAVTVIRSGWVRVSVRIRIKLVSVAVGYQRSHPQATLQADGGAGGLFTYAFILTVSAVEKSSFRFCMILI